MASQHPLLDFLTSPWAIVPDKLFELQAIYAAHFNGQVPDLAAIEARLGRPLANEQQAYKIQDGTAVAVLPIAGVIANKANLFMQVSGGASAQMLQQQVQSMQADTKVKAVVLDMDTPGGSVLGIPALAEAIRALAATKPVVAVSTGYMASAGYWLASAANAVYISGATDVVGSIGVIATHTYDPKRSAVQTTEVTAGKYKRMASDLAPLTAEGRDYLQAQVDEIYRVFVNTVAANRGVSADQVVAEMADGRVFIGQQAITAGLVDGTATVDVMVERLAADPAQFATRRTAAVSPAFAKARRPVSATAPAASLQPQDPETMSKIFLATAVAMACGEAAAAIAEERPDLAAHFKAEGAKAERERIQAVRAQAMPGHDKLIEQLAFDGKTTGPEAAVQVLNAERGALSARAAAIQADRATPVPADATPAADAAPAKPAAAADPMAAARALHERITAKQAEAKAAGRTLSAVDALAQVQKENANG